MSLQDAQSEAFLGSDAICDEFFVDIVETKLNIPRNKFKLRLVLLSPATVKNENYASVLYRVKIKIEMVDTKEKASVDVIIKAMIASVKQMKECSVFARERLIYEKFLRNFEKLWFDRTGEDILFGPRSIKFETDPYDIIVLDDLKAENFQMMNRKVGLDLPHAKILLSKLAKFHAISAVSNQLVSCANIQIILLSQLRHSLGWDSSPSTKPKFFQNSVFQRRRNGQSFC